MKTDHPFPTLITAFLQMVAIVFRIEPLKGLLRADEDLLTILNLFVKE